MDIVWLCIAISVHGSVYIYNMYDLTTLWVCTFASVTSMHVAHRWLRYDYAPLPMLLLCMLHIGAPLQFWVMNSVWGHPRKHTPYNYVIIRMYQSIIVMFPAYNHTYKMLQSETTRSFLTRYTGSNHVFPDTGAAEYPRGLFSFCCRSTSPAETI